MLKSDLKRTNKSLVVEIKSTDLESVLKYLYKILYNMPKFITEKKGENFHILKAGITFQFLSTNLSLSPSDTQDNLKRVLMKCIWKALKYLARWNFFLPINIYCHLIMEILVSSSFSSLCGYNLTK